MTLRAEFRYAVLSSLGVKTLGAFRAFGGWEIGESGDEPCDGLLGADWNVYNTTLDWPGATNYRKTPPLVKNYPSFRDGVAATVKTLSFPRYAALLATARTEGVTADAVGAAIVASGWGTQQSDMDNGLARFRTDPGHYNALLIGSR